MNLQTVIDTVSGIKVLLMDRILDKEGAAIVTCTECGDDIKEREVGNADRVNALRVFVWCGPCTREIERAVRPRN